MFCHSFWYASVSKLLGKKICKDHSKTHLFADYVPHQITEHKDLNTLKQKALTYSQYYMTVSLSYRFPYRISMTFPGSPKPSQSAPLRHSKCYKSQEDIWYLWYHMLGYCQRTTTCQKDFTEERQNYKRLAEGPLSNWGLILLFEKTLPPRGSRSLSNY